MICFIHIGKCGGTSVSKFLKDVLDDKLYYREYHMNKNYNNINNNNKQYIIWLRNPLSRFVSAFNMSYTLIKDFKNKFNKKNINTINLKTCIGAWRLRDSILKNKNCVFSKEYDNLIEFFETPNYLAESLSSLDNTIKRNAIRLMSLPDDHIYKGIGWYLNNGKFIKNKNSKILFVGKLETMDSDIESLKHILITNNLNNNKINETNIKLIRKNKFLDKESKYLSPLAIQNLIEWYKNTDYSALQQLKEHGWITQEIFDSYHTYNI